MPNTRTQNKKRNSKVVTKLDPMMTCWFIFEAAERLFQKDTLIKSEFYSHYRLIRLEGERGLYFAVLQDAVELFQKFAHSKNLRDVARHEEAKAWIFDEYSQGHHFSFSNVCFLLGFDPSYVRKGLKKWLDEGRPYIPLSYFEPRRESERNQAIVRSSRKISRLCRK